MTVRGEMSAKQFTQLGFTLMEVLITVVILSIGLLGLAGLQFDSLRGNHNAFMNSLATAQAWDAADRLRANISGVDAGHYDSSTKAGTDPNCIANKCSASDLSKHDAYVWHTTNAELLPNGQGVVCIDSTPDDGVSQASPACDGNQTDGMDVFAAKVWWDDDRDMSTPLRRYVMSFTP